LPPLAAILLASAWWLLTRRIYPLGHQSIQGLEGLIHRERESLGAINYPQFMVSLVFGLVALAWLSRPPAGHRDRRHTADGRGHCDYGRAAAFVIPSHWRNLEFLMSWEQARNLPWGVLILVGGGLSLGTAIETSGLAEAAAALLEGLANLPLAAHGGRDNADHAAQPRDEQHGHGGHHAAP